MGFGLTTTIPQGQGCLKFTEMVVVDSSTIDDSAWVTVSTGLGLPLRIVKFLSRSDGDVLVRYNDTSEAQDVIPTDTFQYMEIQTNHDTAGSLSGGENCKMAANQLIQFRAPTGVTLSGNVYIVGYA